ncbi:hypothetical protein M514_18575 [Trichuris suis]|uniref:Uncharacterized protein n=1 Tax=Trichuris suis TaxID=68888 RepID=A0A085NIB0_9BILA|nr:hypothetical protein M514_18575 [Trichuris suis]
MFSNGHLYALVSEVKTATVVMSNNDRKFRDAICSRENPLFKRKAYQSTSGATQVWCKDQ